MHMFVCVHVAVLELKSSLLSGSGGSHASRELGVEKGESLELVLVQVLNHFLIRWGQHRWVTCEKTVKVLGFPSALLRRMGGGWSTRGRGGFGKGEGRTRDGQEWMEWVGAGGEENKRGEEWQVETRCEMT